jgi:hypothetical protein
MDSINRGGTDAERCSSHPASDTAEATQISELIRRSLEQASGVSFPESFEPCELSTRDAALFVNLELWHFRRAVRVGLIEDWGNRWPKRVLWQVRKQRPEIVAQVRTFVPVGTNRLAAYLRERSDLDATVTDIHELIKRSVLRPVGSYKGWDTFDPNDLDDLIEDDPAWLERIVSCRKAWEEETVDLREAAATLSVSENVLRRMAWESELCIEPKWGFRERLQRQVVDSWRAWFETPDAPGGSAWKVNPRT